MVNDRVLTLFVLLLVCSTHMAIGQGNEQLVPMRGNPMLLDAARFMERQHSTPASRATDTLYLPFFDDFSEPFSRERGPADYYADTNKWTGYSVYINDHMAINPISIGVMTFDGLDGSGRAYGFNSNISAKSDSIESKRICLSENLENIYLSFHYQAQGNGLAPAASDILVVEFKDTADRWIEVWSAQGYVLTDSTFKRAMIPVADTAFLHCDFQFRFLNYAARAGAVDHWHVDYVKMDADRSPNDTAYNDVAILKGTSNLLKYYQSIPWSHFLSYELNRNEMLAERFYRVRNNWNQIAPDVTGMTSILNDEGNPEPTNFPASGLVQMSASSACINIADACGAPGENFGSDLVGFQYPLNSNSTEDSTYFDIITRINYSAEAVVDRSNNIALNRQYFYNYYAYDDGTAEVGYGLGNLQFPGQVAIRFDALKQDILRSIQYYLNPVAEDLSDDPIRFMVWKGDQVPEELVYMSKEVYFDYSARQNGMNHFFLMENVDPDFTVGGGFPVMSGNFFIGWQQQPVEGQKFSLGFDRSFDARLNTFYSIGAQPWTPSSIPGAVMFRPVFGAPYVWTDVEEPAQTTTQVVAYPNPSTGLIYLAEPIAGQFVQAAIALYDVTGRSVFQQQGYAQGIDASALPKGLYILEVVDNKGQRFTQRVVLQP